ncbi:MAG: VapC toxin family PIN domain ribonuclease [Gemmatimonadaceae bacterium]|nr:VapC toxin family PIN domain ribonuclease [Geodermatophilaceae bacterium]MBA3671614.1 VapC toxin family PIN domain ribonuclease [Gemmatimonadaceae bacterium]
MRSLLDVNVLIALLDADHTSHRSAMTWFGDHARDGWASCPITQNGCVRIMSHPNYPNAHAVLEIVERLRSATADRTHEFWADSESVLDDDLIDVTRIHGPRQITDVYLLALAVANHGRLVTFDTSIALDAVKGATSRHVLRL